jgi:hypothetical protein
MGTGDFYVGGKAPGSEADHSPPSGADVRNACSHTSTLLIRLHGKKYLMKINSYRIKSRNSSVGIATNYGLEDRMIGVRIPAGIFLFAAAFREAMEPTQPPIQCAPGALYLRVKRRAHEADHSRPSSSEVKNAWSSRICLHGVVIS